MTQKSRTKKKSGSGDGFIGRLFAQTRLPAHVTEEQDWYLDTPDVRLTRVFTIVLILHVVAVGGILAFKMVEKASTPATVVATAPAGAEATAGKPNSDARETAPVQTETAAPDKPAPKPAEPRSQKAESIKAGLVVNHPSAPGYRDYRVASGDSLVSIAREMKVSAAELRELNHLSEDTRLTPGKWLMVPGSEKKSPAPPKKSEPKPAASTGIAKADPKPAAKTNSGGPAVRPIEKPPVPAESAPATAASTYEVQKGDTFFGIARQFGLNYKDLMAANGIETPEGLQAGMNLQIPKH